MTATIKSMEKKQGINAIIIEELREMKITIEEKKKHKEKGLNEKSRLKRLTLAEMKELQRKVKKLMKQQLKKITSIQLRALADKTSKMWQKSETIKEKKVVVSKVIAKITVKNEVIHAYTNYQEITGKLSNLTFEIGSIERKIIMKLWKKLLKRVKKKVNHEPILWYNGLCIMFVGER